jgi:hypothetical protein
MANSKKAPKKKPRGRPPKDPESKLSIARTIGFTETDISDVEKIAADEGNLDQAVVIRRLMRLGLKAFKRGEGKTL